MFLSLPKSTRSPRAWSLRGFVILGVTTLLTAGAMAADGGGLKFQPQGSLPTNSRKRLST